VNFYPACQVSGHGSARTPFPPGKGLVMDVIISSDKPNKGLLCVLCVLCGSNPSFESLSNLAGLSD